MSLDPDATGRLERLRLGAWRGVRDERVPLATVAEAIAAHEEPGSEPAPPFVTLKADARSRVTAGVAGGLPVVVKEVRKAGLRRRLADTLRGAPARRGLRAARTLVGHGIGAALALAAVERRLLGVPVRALLVSLDLRPDPTVARLLEQERDRRDELLAGLADLLTALHAVGARHGDLRTQHLHLGRDVAGAPRMRLIDLESLRLAGALGEEARLDDWAQIHASIPDAHASREQRLAAFRRYAEARPFRAGTLEAFAEVERRSVRRGHLFRGLSGDGAPKRATPGA